MFDTLGRLGPSDAQHVATELSVSSPHLRSLLDSVVALGFLDQLDGVYELNDTARRYLVSDGPACMADLVGVAPGPLENWSRLADTVRNGRPARPIEDDPEAFYVPLVEGTFTTMWRCATRDRFEDSLLVDPRRTDPRSRRRRRTVGHRHPGGLPGGDCRHQRLCRRAGGRQAQDRGVRGRRSLRVETRQLLRHRNRAPAVRPIVPRPRVPCRGRQRCRSTDRTGLRRPANRRKGDRGRLLLRPRAQAQPTRRADGRDDDGQHRQRLRRSPPTSSRAGCATPGSSTCAWWNRSASSSASSPTG